MTTKLTQKQKDAMTWHLNKGRVHWRAIPIHLQGVSLPTEYLKPYGDGTIELSDSGKKEAKICLYDKDY